MLYGGFAEYSPWCRSTSSSTDSKTSSDVDPEGATTISYAGTQRIDFHFPNDSAIWSRHFIPEVKVTDSDVIFVGYGVVAPEYGWDDFKDVDVRGKTILMLINDPPVPDPKDPTKLDEAMFKGYAMTYYGRWTYRFEIAAAKGAKAAIIVHQTGPAGYPRQRHGRDRPAARLRKAQA